MGALQTDTAISNQEGRLTAQLSRDWEIWGPNGGYWSRGASAPLEVTPLLHEVGAPRLFYRITLGVRQGEDRWKRELNALLRRNQEKIDAILIEFGVPLLDEAGKKRIDR